MDPGEKQLWQQQTLHLIPGGAGVADMREQYKDGLKLLLIAAGCVLLVACGNLANLMLARGLKDRAQTSIRVALGASRRRLVRKALVESVTLAVIGGIAGIAVAYGGTRLILYLAFQNGSPNNYVPISATPSTPALLFTLGDLRVDRNPLRDRACVDDLACRSGGSSARRKPCRGRKALVGAEVAGDRPGGDVGRPALDSGADGPEPAEPGASELRVRDRRSLHRVRSIRCSATTSPSSWSRCSERSTIACCRFPACAWSRRRSTRL